MCVQPSALAHKAIQYMVLYCLTPRPIPRYSDLTLCPPSPAWDGIEPIVRFAEVRGTRVVNTAREFKSGHWQATTGHCFFQGVYVA